METWRQVLKVGPKEEIDFGEAHAKYRALVLALSDPTIEAMDRLNCALNEARKELGSSRANR